MTLRDDLIAARALIDTPEKWGKERYEHNGCFCAIGALGKVLGKDPDGDLGEVEIALGRALPPEFTAGANLTPGSRVVVFNDDPSTSHADIMALFDRAIEAATERAQA